MREERKEKREESNALISHELLIALEFNQLIPKYPLKAYQSHPVLRLVRQVTLYLLHLILL